MEQKSIKLMLIITGAFAFLSIPHLLNLKGFEDVKAIYIVSLLTSGIGIGAFIISLIVFVKSRKKIAQPKPAVHKVNILSNQSEHWPKAES